MIRPYIPDNEKQRLKELESYQILDTLPEEEYDDITRIASQICQTSISLISLVDEDRQWFKSHHGTASTETPREYAFCAHAINKTNEVLMVSDSRIDERFYDNPLVTGDPYIVFYTGVPLVSPKGLALGTLCVVDDKPKQLSQEQITSLKSLANQVVRLMESRKGQILLKNANTALEAKYKELEKFALIAAHDIKSPLNNISTIINFLIQGHGEKLDENANKLLETLDKSAEQLRRLVDGILSYSRSEKVLSRNIEEIDFHSFITDICELMNPGSDCNFIYPDTKHLIKVNKVALEQIFINLISNAIKYNDKKQVNIEIGFTEKEEEYEFFVKDNGPGMEPQYHDRIFNIFEILQSSDKEGNRGSGVGLATVKKLIEGQNGKIWLESELGIGTCFYFTIEKQI